MSKNICLDYEGGVRVEPIRGWGRVLSRRRRVYHQGVSLAYHQHEVLYIIKSQIYARRGVMIYSPLG